jgi:hypothetical protein
MPLLSERLLHVVVYTSPSHSGKSRITPFWEVLIVAGVYVLIRMTGKGHMSLVLWREREGPESAHLAHCRASRRRSSL